MSRKDEDTWTMIQAAFAETEKIMTERGWNAGDVDHEYLRRAVERQWTDDGGRNALKAKVNAAVSIEVDGLFDTIEGPSGVGEIAA